MVVVRFIAFAGIVASLSVGCGTAQFAARDEGDSNGRDVNTRAPLHTVPENSTLDSPLLLSTAGSGSGDATPRTSSAARQMTAGRRGTINGPLRIDGPSFRAAARGNPEPATVGPRSGAHGGILGAPQPAPGASTNDSSGTPAPTISWKAVDGPSPNDWHTANDVRGDAADPQIAVTWDNVIVSGNRAFTIYTRSGYRLVVIAS